MPLPTRDSINEGTCFSLDYEDGWLLRPAAFVVVKELRFKQIRKIGSLLRFEKQRTALVKLAVQPHHSTFQL